MKKILIVISQDLYAKHHLTFNSFKLVEDKYDCSYLASEAVKIFKGKISKKKNFLGFLKENHKNDRLSKILSDALLLANRHKSSSFPLRVVMRFNLNFRNVLRKPFWKIPFRILIRLYYSSIIFSTRAPLSLLVKNKFLLKKINDHTHSNKKFGEIIKKLKPDLIILPNSGYDKLFFQSIVESKKNNVKTLAIIDNWDNLSTKSIMAEKPNFLGVWGEQSKQHAVKIQNFKSDQCKIIGSARYQEYFELRNIKLKSHFDFDYILFLGTSWNWNEEDVIKYLDKIISENKVLKNNYKIIYRPHPFRQGKTIPLKLDNVIYDPEILKILNNQTHNQSDLNYYPSLLQNAKFVMGGPQTMMIEAVIFNKFYLALIHDDKINYTNMKKVFSAYEHFRGIENIESIHFCYDLAKLDKEILNIISLESFNLNKIDSQRNHILFNDKHKYDKTILNAIDEILEVNPG